MKKNFWFIFLITSLILFSIVGYYLFVNKSSEKVTPQNVQTQTIDVFLSGVTEKNNRIVFDAEEIQWFGGDEAIAMAMQDTGCSRETIEYASCASSIGSGYYIHKTGKRHEGLSLSSTAPIILLTNGTEETKMTAKDLLQKNNFDFTPYSLTLEGDTAVMIKQVYIP